MARKRSKAGKGQGSPVGAPESHRNDGSQLASFPIAAAARSLPTADARDSFAAHCIRAFKGAGYEACLAIVAGMQRVA